jgi:uncharacterized protein YbaP (TraB family)
MFPSGSDTAQDRGFLWRISKGGHTSHLYGTVHIAKQGWMAGLSVLPSTLAIS